MIAILLALSTAHAGQAPDFTVTTAADSGALIVTAVPPAAHHINIKAPMRIENTRTGAHSKPVSAEASKVVFRLKGASARELSVGLYLCDDANTFCEKHEVKISTTGQVVAAAQSVATPPSPALGATRGGKVKLERGFIMNAPEAALAEALRRKAPLLIDFFGIWCPPCNMLDETVFPTKEFAKATARFVKLKLDADSPVSWALKARYHVLGYPTVILASPDGDEITRVVGYRPRADFISAVEKAWASRGEPYSALKLKADAGDAAAALRVGQTHLERGEYEIARQYLAKATGQPGADVALFNAEIGTADSGSPAKLAEVLEASLLAQGGSVDAIDWRSKLADTYALLGQETKARSMLEELVKAVDDLVTHPAKLAGHDALPADLLELAADAQEKLGPPEKARAAWSRAAEAYRTGAKGAAERGFNLELAYCLGRAGDTPASEKIYAGLEKRFPREFTFYFGHARMLLGLKKGAPARPLAQKAYEYSYGDNRLRAAELLAKIYAEENRNDEALKVIRETLAATQLPTDATIRTHRYADKLRQLEKRLASAGK